MVSKSLFILTSMILLIMKCYVAADVQQVVPGAGNAELAPPTSTSTSTTPTVAAPISTSPPPEGNTTFLDGTTWCVALPGVSQADLQNALDWACGKTDCNAIRSGGPCYEPDTLLSHASFAFNEYYQQNGNSDIACNFGGAATLTKKNPSYGKCLYAAASAGSSVSSATRLMLVHKGVPDVERYWGTFTAVLLLLYLRR